MDSRLRGNDLDVRCCFSVILAKAGIHARDTARRSRKGCHPREGGDPCLHSAGRRPPATDMAVPENV